MPKGGDCLTVGNKVHQTLASLRSANADMEAFAMETQDKEAQQLYTNSAQQLEQILSDVNSRANYIEKQEPQYNTKKNNQRQ